MSLSSLGIVAAACCAWLLWRLATCPESDELRAAEWFLPLSGRWLRYVVVAIIWVVLLVCLFSGFGSTARPPLGTLHS